MKLSKKFLLGACMGLIGVLGFSSEAMAADEVTLVKSGTDYQWTSSVSVNSVEVKLGDYTVSTESTSNTTGDITRDSVKAYVEKNDLGEQLDKSLTVTVTDTDNNTFSASTAFEDIYKLTATGNNGTFTVNDKSKVYAFSGDKVTVKAVPDTGYKFVRWADGNTEATREVPVSASTTFTGTCEAEIPSVESVTLLANGKSSISIYVNDTFDLTWDVLPAGSALDPSTISFKVVSGSSSYLKAKSSSSALQNGLVTFQAVSAGTVKIRFTAKDTTGKSVTSTDVTIVISKQSSGGDDDDDDYVDAQLNDISGYNYITVGYPLSLSTSVKKAGDGEFENDDIIWKVTGDSDKYKVDTKSGKSITFTPSGTGTFTIKAILEEAADYGDEDVVKSMTVTVYDKPTIKYEDRKLIVTVPEKVNTGTTSGGSDSNNFTACDSIKGGKLEVLFDGTSLGTTSTAKTSGTSFTIDASTVETLINNLKSKFSKSGTVTFRLYPCDSSANINKNIYADATASLYEIKVAGTGVTEAKYYGLSGQTITIEAVPTSGSDFAGTWEDDKTIATGKRDIVVTENKTYTAVLGEKALESATDYGEYDEVPKTGEGNTMLYVLLALIAAGSVAGCVVFKSVKKNNI